jgi:hypothetical protein
MRSGLIPYKRKDLMFVRGIVNDDEHATVGGEAAVQVQESFQRLPRFGDSRAEAVDS